ncbi:MAG: sulfotransferase [Xenococcaceae cyanobacterium MO_167.B27]|nr:sulfotransferase [Xenococcaceae cyanobacterium MO_167.B27]
MNFQFSTIEGINTNIKSPNFFIVGVEKAGTTALYEYLKAHPQIYMPHLKEPAFFYPQWKNRPIKMWEEYYELFNEVKDEVAIGDASPQYFNTLGSAEKIKLHVPSAKIIIILRQPVDRAYSHYMMHINGGKSMKYQNFVDVFREVKDSLVLTSGQGDIPYWGLGNSFYYDTLLHYYQLFDRSKIKIYLYEDLRSNPLEILSDIYKFLQVDPLFTPDTRIEVNKGSGMPKNKLIHRLIRKPNLIKNLSKKILPDKFRSMISKSLIAMLKTEKQSLNTQTKGEFTKVFLDDIHKLESLLGRDLSIWYEDELIV